jgi:hypothetical protein
LLPTLSPLLFDALLPSGSLQLLHLPAFLELHEEGLARFIALRSDVLGALLVEPLRLVTQALPLGVRHPAGAKAARHADLLLVRRWGGTEDELATATSVRGEVQTQNYPMIPCVLVFARAQLRVVREELLELAQRNRVLIRTRVLELESREGDVVCLLVLEDANDVVLVVDFPAFLQDEGLLRVIVQTRLSSHDGCRRNSPP